MPHLAGRLPLAVPELVAIGEPTGVFPHPWSILRWLDCESAAPHALNTVENAAALAHFIRALQRIDPAEGLAAGPANNSRGVALAIRDAPTRKAIAAVADEIDEPAAIRLWDSALAAPEHTGPGTWIHGDIHPGNVLARGEALAAVIDWGCAGIGDPAVDLMPAWSIFSGPARKTFRDTINADEPTWDRARGWTLSVSAIALAYYRDKNPILCEAVRRDISELLAD